MNTSKVDETKVLVADLSLELIEMKILITEFFRLLEIKEESDEGVIFQPNYISSCRALDSERMSIILQRLKELI